MKRNQFGMLVAATVLGAALLAGCSSDSSSTDSTPKTVDEIYEIVSAANPIDNARELNDMSIELDYMLSLDDIVSYKGVASNDNGDAGMVIVIEATDEAADAVFAAMESYATTQAAFWSNYEEFADAQASVESSRIKRDGNIIVQVFAANGADYTDIEAALTEAFS